MRKNKSAEKYISRKCVLHCEALLQTVSQREAEYPGEQPALAIFQIA